MIIILFGCAILTIIPFGALVMLCMFGSKMSRLDDWKDEN